jgi:hypothetical protein
MTNGHKANDGAPAFHVIGFRTNCGISEPESAGIIRWAQLCASASCAQSCGFDSSIRIARVRDAVCEY